VSLPQSIVKICGITNGDDALAAVEAGASAIGFNFWSGSPRHIDPGDAARIAAELSKSVLRVGVFVDETAERITDVAREAGLDVVQLHGGPAAVPNLRCWRAYRVGADGALAIDDAGTAEAILLDAAVPGMRGGTGQSFPWESARNLARRIVLAGGLDASSVREAIRAARPWGVDACSRLESSPGRKDHGKMKAFITEALSEFA